MLKRFCWTEYARAKIDTQVEFPLNGLDLAQYSTRKEEEEAESNEICYSLKAVVSHHGKLAQEFVFGMGIRKTEPQISQGLAYRGATTHRSVSIVSGRVGYTLTIAGCR